MVDLAKLQPTLVVLVLLLLALPTMGASCIPLWVLADQESRRVRATGTAPPDDARLLKDVGIAGTVVFGACLGSMGLYVLYFASAS